MYVDIFKKIGITIPLSDGRNHMLESYERNSSKEILILSHFDLS